METRTPRLTTKQITQPASEPVALADLLAWSRIDTSADNAVVASLITRARMHCEQITERQFISAQWGLKLDEFPAEWDRRRFRATSRREGTDILLPRPPLISVDSIVYKDANGATQTVDPSVYIVSTYDEPGRIALAYNQVWPDTYVEINAVTITYTAGWADAASVPEPIKQAILMLSAHWYENREATANASMVPREIDFAVSNLLSPYTCREIF